MIYKLRFTPTAVKDIQKLKKTGDKKLLQKLAVLLEELKKHQRTGTGKPGNLKHELEGFYSRRINKKHRLIYDIKDDIIVVVVLSAHSHYGDK